MDYNLVLHKGIWMVLTPIILVLLPMFLVVFVFGSIVNWKIYKKAGKEGWEAIIPIYAQAVLLQITNIPVWFIVLLLVPFVNGIGFLLFHVFTSINLAKAFNKENGFIVVLIFFSIIGFAILAFGKDEYHLPEPIF